MDPTADLTQVVRPRDLPLLTSFETAEGKRHVWTTFSRDQIDLNYSNPEVLLEVLDLLLFYVRQGAQLLRLDAIAFLWKAVGPPSIHLPQTHRVVKLIRAVVDAVAPGVLLVTETNGPDEENFSFFGNGDDEAHALTDPAEFSQAPGRAVARFLTAQAIMLSLAGVPAVYFHNLLGSRNDRAGYRRTGRLRSLNREKLKLADFQQALGNPADHRRQVFNGYSRLLRARTGHPAFGPLAAQRILDLGPAVFGLVRESTAAGRVVCLHEVAGAAQELDVPLVEHGGQELIAHEALTRSRVSLAPYQVRWIAIDSRRSG